MNSLKSYIDNLLDLVNHFTDKSYCVCKKCGHEWAWSNNEKTGAKEYRLNEKCSCGSKEYEIKYLLDNNAYVIKVLGELARAYRAEIHEYLVPSHLPDKEAMIRTHIRDIMTKVKPVVDGRISAIKEQYSDLVRKRNYSRRDEALEDRIKELEGFYNRYSVLKEDFNALIAFRHFETFALYIDRIFGNTVYTPSLHLFKGFYYYANSMVLNGDIKFIEKQCFAGAGKSATDCALIAFLFGVDINNDVLKIFGNSSNVRQAMDMIVSIMTSPEYAKIFPYFSKYNCDKNAIFSYCQLEQGEFKITGSIRSCNLRICAKGEKVDGVRAKYLFLDDITAADDTDKQYQKDIDLYISRWFKRKYNNNNFYIIASGTTYSLEDLLSFLKHHFGADRAKPTPFKFTSISTSDEIVKNGKSVFCVIYGLDEKEKSTFEERFPTLSFLLEREKNPRNFMAMVQQQPQPPLGAPFDYDNLPNLYGTEGIPHLQDRSQEVCRASLDPSRKGKDFHSMPIVVNIGDRLYLQDCIFDKCPPEQLPEKVVNMIEKHHIVHLDVECNTDETFDVLIKKLLKERGINYCKVTKFFSWKKKDEKIRDYETAIKSIYYPARGVYGDMSPMGKFMHWLTIYNYEKPPEHDDSVDSLANFAQTFIVNKQIMPKAKVLSKKYY